MANEELTIAQNDARLTVIGKSWADVTTDSGDGITIDQLVIGEIEDITGLDLPDIGDDTRIIIGYDDSGDPWLYIDGLDDPYDLGDLDLDLLDLDFELGSSLVIGDLNVSVDDDLKIREEELPTSIVIVTEPKKLRYVEGSRIDLSGMVVTAKKEDGSTWTSAKYPNGHIPLGELIVDPLVASMEGSDYYIAQPTEAWEFGTVPFGGSLDFDWGGGKYHQEVYDGYKFITAIGATSDFRMVNFREGPGGYAQYTYDGKTVSYTYSHAIGSHNPSILVPNSSTSWNDAARIAWTAIYGEVNGANIITVSWPRPGDRMPLSASFVVTVEPRRGNGGR